MAYTKYFMDGNIPLNDRGEKLGMDMKAFTEGYNKLPFRQKAYITAALIGGGAAAATAGLPTLASLLAGGMYTQRALGGAGFALNRRKGMETRIAKNPEHWLAERSDTFKNTYAAVLGGVYIGVSAIAGRYATEKVTEWLGNLFGHHAAVPEAPQGVRGSSLEHSAPSKGPITGLSRAPEVLQSAPASGVGATAPAPVAAASAPTVEAPAAVSAAGEAAAVPATAVEIPDVSVEATQGKGYEYMMKRLWEQLQEKDLDPKAYAEGSDIRRLLEADQKSIDTLVHQIAADPKHSFFNPDGTSVRIDLGSHLTVNADGQLELNGAVQAPADAPVTPAYHPETPAVAAPAIVSPPHVETVDLTAAQEEAAKHIEPMPSQDVPIPPPTTEQPLVWRDSSGNALVDGSGNPVHAGVAEALPGANSFGIVVPETIPHIYADPTADRLFAYGGSPTERAKLVSEYLMRNPGKIVFAADEAGAHRVPWHLVEGKVVAGPPMRTNGILGLFSTHLNPPGPEEFRKVIK